MALTTYVEAIRQGIWEEMEQDERVFVLGEDVGIYGGAFKVTAGMLERFGEGEYIGAQPHTFVWTLNPPANSTYDETQTKIVDNEL